MHRLKPMSTLRTVSFGLLALWLTASGCGGGGLSNADGSAADPATASASGIIFEDNPVILAPTVTLPGGANGNIISLGIATVPTNGTAVVLGTTLRYTPNLNFFGIDQFDFSATLTTGSVIGTATVTVEALAYGTAYSKSDAGAEVH